MTESSDPPFVKWEPQQYHLNPRQIKGVKNILFLETEFSPGRLEVTVYTRGTSLYLLFLIRQCFKRYRCKSDKPVCKWRVNSKYVHRSLYRLP